MPVGFTLIELLVVISIVVLLISILLPVITKAEQVANQVLCSSNLRQIAIGVSTYVAENKDYTPGPNTSGLRLLQIPAPADSEAVAASSNPVTPDDWVSPVFGQQWGLSGNDRGQKIKQILNRDEMLCPANEFRYDHRTGPAYSALNAIATVQLASYSMPYALHAYASAAVTPATGGFHLGSQDRNAINIAPASHRFRIDSLGMPSDKVLAADGANVVNYATNQLVLDTTYGSRGEGGLPNGGIFMSRGATLNASSFSGAQTPYRQGAGFDPATTNDLARQVTYRHDGAINGVFWDGHAENLTVERSRTAHFWFPSGSVAQSNFHISDSNVNAGDTIR